MLAALVLQLALAAPPTELTVEFRSTAQTCDLEPLLGSALSRWLPGLVLHTGGSRAMLKLVVSTQARALELAIRDDAGALLLARSLPRGPDCAADADAIALVVERYLRDLGWEPVLPPLPLEQAETSTVPLLSEGARTSSPADAPRERGLFAVGFAAGIAMRTDPSVRLGGGLAILGRTWLTRVMELSLEGTIKLPWAKAATRQDNTEIGGFELSSWSLAGGLGACASLGPGWGCTSFRAGVEVFAAGVSGPLVFHPSSAISPRFAASAEVRYDLPIWGPFELTAAAGLTLRPQPPIFAIEDAQSPYKVPPLEPSLRLGGWMRFFGR